MKKILILTLLILTACSSTVTSTPVSFFEISTTPNVANSQPPQAILTTPMSTLPQGGSLPVVTESSPTSEEEAGELYFFLQPRNGGGSIQLARVSGLCTVDGVNCPPLQLVTVPFAFNFTINALSWSPDGKLAAFAYSDQPNGSPTKLWLFDPSANTWISLAQFPYIDPPFWSPDGAWIAFLVRDGLGGEDAYVIHADGSGLKEVGADLPADARPYIMDGWYTDKVMMRSALTSDRIFLVNANDGLSRPMFDSPLIKNAFVAAPDASLLAYDEFDQGNPAHVLKAMTPDGSNVSTLASFIDGGSIYPLVWSPDSRMLAFAHYAGVSGNPSAEVYVVNRDGSNLSLIYKGVTIGHLIFSPDGRYLLVEETTSATGGHLFLVNLATREQKILQAPGLSTDYDWYAPSWRP